MILPHHPDFNAETLPEALLSVMPKTLYLGFWRNDQHPELPHPREYQDILWGGQERALVVRYLSSAPVVLRGRGSSWCRFCKATNGSTELSDGIYTWPEGLAHYCQDHWVRPPLDFVQHVRLNSPP